MFVTGYRRTFVLVKISTYHLWVFSRPFHQQVLVFLYVTFDYITPKSGQAVQVKGHTNNVQLVAKLLVNLLLPKVAPCMQHLCCGSRLALIPG